MQLRSSGILSRSSANPILSSADVPYPASLVFNAGVCKYQGRYVMVFRNDYGCDEAAWEGGKRFDGTNLGIAFSSDGVVWRVCPKPMLGVEEARSLLAPFYPDRDTCVEVQRFYDPRLTVIDGRVFMCFAVDTVHGLRGGIAVTDDFEEWDVLSLSQPDNRNFVLFPERVGGRYHRLDRPMPVYSRGRDRFDLWLSESPDLVYWGNSSLLLAVEDLLFANNKIGPGAPPIRTEQGWLAVIHTVDLDADRGKNGWEASWRKRYCASLMLLDLHDPSQIIGYSREPLLAPEAGYETACGFRQDVIFPGGMILEDSGEVKIYYGAADTVECLATAHVDDLVKLCGGG